MATFFLAPALALTGVAYGQSTFGTVVGAVQDPSGGVVPGAKVELVDTGTNAAGNTLTGASGSYQFVNIDVGTYRIVVEAPGFQKMEFQPFDLTARKSKHIDIESKLVSQAASMDVEAVATIQKDASNIAESKGSLELTDLPSLSLRGRKALLLHLRRSPRNRAFRPTRITTSL